MNESHKILNRSIDDKYSHSVMIRRITKLFLCHCDIVVKK